MTQQFLLPTLIGLTFLLPNVAVAQLPSVPPTVSPGPIETAYTMGAGDRLQITVFNVPEYSGEYQVLVDGTLELPVIGSLSVQDLTLSQVTQLLTRRYAPLVQRPIVTVKLLAPRPLKVAIAGEIQRPGAYTIPLEANQRFPTLTQAIQLAGGLTHLADVHQVQLKRSLQGTSQYVLLDLWELLQQGNLAQDITLRDGDTIVIPTATRIDIAQSRQLAAANLAAAGNVPVKIAILGEISRPGSYTLKPEGGEAGVGSLPILTQAIAEAGGITPQADIRRIQIRRPTRTAQIKAIDVNLWEMLAAGDLGQDLLLQEGDTIVIPQAEQINPDEANILASTTFSPDAIKIYVVGEVRQPGMVQLPPNTPLNQALLAAGGFDQRRAKKGSVELVRLNPDGTVAKRSIGVDFARGLDAQNNPALRNNDVIVVGRSGLTSFSDTASSVLSPLGGLLSIFNFLRIFQ